MYIGDQASFDGSGERSLASGLPREVELLYRREREIAAVIYRRGLATAEDVRAELTRDLSNPAVRSMLNRLVTKGILTRTRYGPYGTFIYGPALTPTSAREMALRRFAEDYYSGSLPSLARAIADLFASQSHFVETEHRVRQRA